MYVFLREYSRILGRTNIYLKIFQGVMNRLSSPYGDCNTLEQLKKYNQPFYFNGTYSVEGCYRSCFQKKLTNYCECADPRFPPSDPTNTFCTYKNAEKRKFIFLRSIMAHQSLELNLIIDFKINVIRNIYKFSEITIMSPIVNASSRVMKQFIRHLYFMPIIIPVELFQRAVMPQKSIRQIMIKFTTKIRCS